MAGDELKKVQDGQPLAIPAAAYNAFIDATRKLKELEHQIQRGLLNARGPQPAVVLVKNNSGGAVGRFGVLGIDAPLITPTANLDTFKQQVVLIGSTPTDDHRGKFIVLLEPLVSGAIGRAVIAGVVACRCLFATGDETLADTETGDDTRLAALGNGSAKVLWKETGTGEKWAVVRLQGANKDLDLYYLNGALARGGNVNADLLTWGGTDWDTHGASTTIYDPLKLGPAISGSLAWCFPSLLSGRVEIVSLEPLHDLCHLNGNPLTDIPAGSDITTAKILALEDGCVVYFNSEECP